MTTCIHLLRLPQQITVNLGLGGGLKQQECVPQNQNQGVDFGGHPSSEGSRGEPFLASFHFGGLPVFLTGDSNASLSLCLCLYVTCSSIFLLSVSSPLL